MISGLLSARFLISGFRIFIHSISVRLLVLSFFLSLGICTDVSGQEAARKQVKLIHADNIFFDKSIVDAQRLIGNVQLLYEGTTFFCDSAYLYPTQNFDAFSRIRADKPGVYSLTGDNLFFDKANQTARVQRGVTLKDGEMTLTSDQMVYNMDSEMAQYVAGGRIVSSKNKNILTSRKGSYSVRSQTFFFRDKVVLTNPEYTVSCDTLQYNETSEVAYFFGPTHITSKDTKIYCENGWYNTREDICQFNENAQVTSEKTILKGDSIFYNGKKGFGEVFRKVSIRDTTSNFIITGEYGKHIESTKESLVTQRALLIQAFDSDSLFLSADTLLARPDSLDQQLIRAFHNVRIFKEDLQGVSDSLTYFQGDSTIQLFHSPVLWSEENQITGDSIRIRTWQGHIDRLIVRGNSFIASDALKNDSLSGGAQRYNQIKGRNTEGFFRENALHQVKVIGNGQLIYFALEEKGETPQVIGQNKGECSDIHITIENNQIQRINLIREPNSVFTPIKMATESEFELEGFRWRGSERPRRKDLSR